MTIVLVGFLVLLWWSLVLGVTAVLLPPAGGWRTWWLRRPKWRDYRNG